MMLFSPVLEEKKNKQQSSLGYQFLLCGRTNDTYVASTPHLQLEEI